MIRDSRRNEKKSFYVFRDFDEEDGGTDFMGGNYACARAVFSVKFLPPTIYVTMHRITSFKKYCAEHIYF